jgi:predicted RNA binding protein YcfA (HicA-like mRNA interferase family)
LGRLKPQPFREITRRLEAIGFDEASQKGSHVKFVRRVGEVVDTAIVPGKRDVSVGTLRTMPTSVLTNGKNSPERLRNHAAQVERGVYPLADHGFDIRKCLLPSRTVRQAAG